MINKIVFYTKVGYKLLKGDTVGKKDYKEGYNHVSTTYNQWLEQMGQYTQKMVKPEYILKKEKYKILDFACGTGYISKLLLDMKLNCEITAVDVSDKMLNQLKSLGSDNVKLVNSDGIEFLKSTKEKYDAIFFGWALSYFNYKDLFALFSKVLKPKGTVGIITNTRGTLKDIENIFLKVMCKNSKEFLRPMDIKFNLPRGRVGLVKWFNQFGFKELESNEREVILSFQDPDQLLEWLNKTGAIAGTASIFKDYDRVKGDLLKEIKRKKYREGKYEINHKFAYGTFRLE